MALLGNCVVIENRGKDDRYLGFIRNEKFVTQAEMKILLLFFFARIAICDL